METHKIIETPTYFIAHSNGDIVHFGKEEQKGNEIATGQSNLEIYTDESSWRSRLHFLGFTNDEIDKRIN